MALQESTDITVRTASGSDADALAAIYNHYVAHTIVTFEEAAVGVPEFRGRIVEVLNAALPWLVAEVNHAVVGYAYATKWRPRRAYRFSTEVTVYVASDSGGRGVGTALYTRLFADLRQRDVHAAMGGIALPNAASIALHEKFGFKKVAHFEQTGFKFDRWIDVGYWQRVFSRDDSAR